MIIKKIISSLFDHTFCFRISRRIYRFFEKSQQNEQKPLFACDYIFDDRTKNSENLLIVLLGFQPYYWDVLLDRVNHNVMQINGDIDVCLCVPSGVNEEWKNVRNCAQSYGFSFLYIYEDILAQVQNTAIKLHPNAKWIYKIDEDILIPDNYLDDLKKSYEKAENYFVYNTGFLAPLINLNGACTHHFLQALSINNEYEQKFGKYYVGSLYEAPVHINEEVAEFIWENTIPFDQVAKHIKNSEGEEFFLSPIRFSIGAILCTREFWNKIGYFKLSPVGCGAEEEIQMNNYCQTNMLGIVIAKKILVGHLGFYSQKSKCKCFYETHYNEIKHK